MAKKKEANTFDDLFSNRVDKKKERDLFDRLSGTDGLTEYLRATIADDVKRYYSATTPLEQSIIRGAADRTRYFLTLLKERGALTPTSKKRVTLRSPRHAT